jgi:predicted nucleic acid-binding protein
MTLAAYMDASALVKLILIEPGSDAMVRWYVEAERVLSSRIGVIETLRAVARGGTNVDAEHRASILASLEVFEVDAEVAKDAATIGPPALRTLDAIHLATARSIPGLDAFVTYDDRLADAARDLGLPVVSPA